MLQESWFLLAHSCECCWKYFGLWVKFRIQVDHSSYEVINGLPWSAYNGKIWGMMAHVGMSIFLQRSSFWSTDCILDGGSEYGGKLLGKVLDCSPCWDITSRITLGNIGTAGFKIQRENKREVQRRGAIDEGKREKIWFFSQAGAQGNISAPNRCQCFRWISYFRVERAH